MIQISLNGDWILEIPGLTEEPEAASVPGSVLGDLAAAEKIPDGAWLQDPEQVRRLLERGASYSRPFPVSQALLDGDRVWLRCQGLDGLARITVNGMEVGRADNMHRVWEYSIKRVLRPGINEITVDLSLPPEGRLRRPQSAPEDMGIWREIAICSARRAYIRDVLLTQACRDGAAVLGVHTAVESYSGPVETEVTVTAPDGSRCTAAGTDCAIELPSPRLWQPGKGGLQPLYMVTVRLLADGVELDRWMGRTGLREIELENGKAGPFLLVNGSPLPTPAEDWTFPEELPGRRDPAWSLRLLRKAWEKGTALLRLPAAGYYPEDWFYDACDELGIAVIQPLAPAAGLSQVKAEAEYRDNVRRLRNHPALAAWLLPADGGGTAAGILDREAPAACRFTGD